VFLIETLVGRTLKAGGHVYSGKTIVIREANSNSTFLNGDAVHHVL
jgi:hypothetical protein